MPGGPWDVTPHRTGRRQAIEAFDAASSLRHSLEQNGAKSAVLRSRLIGIYVVDEAGEI
jgi:hypothetical protein